MKEKMNDFNSIELTLGNVIERQKLDFDIANTPEVKAQLLHWCAGYEIRLSNYYYQNMVEKREVIYPINWWEAFKKEYFPKILKKYFPIKENVVVLTSTNVYPSIPISGRTHKSIPLILENKYIRTNVEEE